MVHEKVVQKLCFFVLFTINGTIVFKRGIEKDGLGEIKDFHVGHQYLDDNYPDLSLSAILLCEDDFDCRIISVT